MRRLFSMGTAAALLATLTAGFIAPAHAVPVPGCVSNCKVYITPADGQVVVTLPENAVDVTLTVTAGAGGSNGMFGRGPGGYGGAVTTDLGSAYNGKELHLLAGAAGLSRNRASGGQGSYVASAEGFVAVAGGGGGGGEQHWHNGDGYSQILELAGGSGGFFSPSGDGADGEDQNNSRAYGTGAVGSTPGSGSWAAQPETGSIKHGGDGTRASVAADGTITPGLGGMADHHYPGGGGGGYAGGGSGSFAYHTHLPGSDVQLNGETNGPGGGGSNFLAAGLSPVSRGYSVGDGYVWLTYSLDATVPGAPTGLKATPDPYSWGAQISWTPPADDGGAEVLGYVLQRSTDGIDWSHEQTLAADPASGYYSDYGLALGTTYYYRLAARNGAGTGPFSEVTSVVSQTFPGPVQRLTATPGNKTATLTWDAPSRDAGTPVIRYEVQYVSELGDYGNPVIVPDDQWVEVSPDAASPYSMTGLNNKTLYSFRVRAINAQGPSQEWQYTQASPSAPFYNFDPAITTLDGEPLHGSTISPGTEFLVSQSGLPAGATLTVTLIGPHIFEELSTLNTTAAGGTVLGTATVDNNGELRLESAVPTDLIDGFYSITSSFVDPERPNYPQSVHFKVAAAAAEVPPGETPVVDPGTTPVVDPDETSVLIPEGAGQVPGPSAAVDVIIPAAADVEAEDNLSGTLAVTGASQLAWLMTAGALLLAAGAALRFRPARRVI